VAEILAGYVLGLNRSRLNHLSCPSFPRCLVSLLQFIIMYNSLDFFSSLVIIHDHVRQSSHVNTLQFFLDEMDTLQIDAAGHSTGCIYSRQAALASNGKRDYAKNNCDEHPASPPAGPHHCWITYVSPSTLVL
jgi:hypothetical protein